jgi:cell division protein FtsL
MISALFTHRTRGFRTLNVLLASVLLVLAIGVNLAKTSAGKERAEIGRTEREMKKERARIRVLEAEVAHLEQPERLERLSRAYLAMAPIGARQETTYDGLYDISRRAPGHAPAPAPVAASTPPAPVVEETGGEPEPIGDGPQ